MFITNVEPSKLWFGGAGAQAKKWNDNPQKQQKSHGKEFLFLFLPHTGQLLDHEFLAASTLQAIGPHLFLFFNFFFLKRISFRSFVFVVALLSSFNKNNKNESIYYTTGKNLQFTQVQFADAIDRLLTRSICSRSRRWREESLLLVRRLRFRYRSDWGQGFTPMRRGWFWLVVHHAFICCGWKKQKNYGKSLGVCALLRCCALIKK